MLSNNCIKKRCSIHAVDLNQGRALSNQADVNERQFSGFQEAKKIPSRKCGTGSFFYFKNPDYQIMNDFSVK